MSNTETVPTTCLVCGQADGVGVWIGGFRICPDCEEGLLHSTPDGEEYEELVTRLRPLGAATLSAWARPALEADRPT